MHVVNGQAREDWCIFTKLWNSQGIHCCHHISPKGIAANSLSLSNRAVCFKTNCAARGESYRAGNGQASLGECTEKHVALTGIQIDTLWLIWLYTWQGYRLIWFELNWYSCWWVDTIYISGDQLSKFGRPQHCLLSQNICCSTSARMRPVLVLKQ